ncbi:MAG: LacI family transcriptional regulator [Acidobacteria bacterium]|nr:MAG: LacI family transcriptional regulator [Acidobacteriota bacterium]
MKPVSIKDIAKAAGVSHPTVSRALCFSPLVKAETAQRIRDMATAMGYRPNAVARGLVTRRTRTIGAVVTTLTDPFHGEVLSGVEELASDHHYSVFVANCNADADREIRVVKLFQERRVDGIVVMCSRVGALYAPLLRELKIPIVLINSNYPNDVFDSVAIDNLGASLQAVQHLISLGHSQIAYLGDQFGLDSDRERFAGYRQALLGAGLPVVTSLTVCGDGTPEGGQAAAARLLALPEPPTAIFCYNDQSAIGALSAIRVHGLRVPEDVSIVGFDDLRIASFANPPLTTVRQPRQLMGRTAAGILLDLLSGSVGQTHVQIPGELIIRRSTATCSTAVSDIQEPAI